MDLALIDQAINTYKNKDAYKAHKIMYKGKEQNLGTFGITPDKLFSPTDKNKSSVWKEVLFVAANPDLNNKWWKSEVAFVDANQQLEYLGKEFSKRYESGEGYGC